MLTASLQRGKTPHTPPRTKLPVDCGWQPIMLEDRIQVAKQSLTWQSTLRYGPYWAGWAIREAQFDHSTDQDLEPI